MNLTLIHFQSLSQNNVFPDINLRIYGLNIEDINGFTDGEAQTFFANLYDILRQDKFTTMITANCRN